LSPHPIPQSPIPNPHENKKEEFNNFMTIITIKNNLIFYLKYNK